MNGTPVVGDEGLEMDQEEDRMMRLEGMPLVEREVPKYFEIVDVGDIMEDGSVYATVAFMPPEGGEGSGKFHLTFRIFDALEALHPATDQRQAELVDWLAERGE